MVVKDAGKMRSCNTFKEWACSENTERINIKVSYSQNI